MKTFRGILLLCLLCLPLFFAACAQKTREATLLYTTDVHGRIVSGDKAIGMDTIAAVHAATPGSLLVDAGDYLQGNPIVNLSQGKTAIEVMKMAGYFAAAVGNHEFDFGRETLLLRSAEAKAGPNPLHLLSANVLTPEGAPVVEPAAVATVNGLKIGLFGLTTPETAVQTHPRHVDGLTFADPVDTAKAMTAMLRGRGCDLVVALVHLGTLDVTGLKSTDLADRVPGLDIIVDGHSHAVVEYVSPVTGVLVVSSGAHAQNLGKLEIKPPRAAGEKPQTRNTLLQKTDLAGVTPDAKIGQKLAAVLAEQEAILSERIADSPVDLDAERTRIRSRETNFGSLCADALLYVSGADMAVVNGGGIRRSIAKGPVTMGDVVAALPFSDATITKKVTGAQLKEILEFGFRDTPVENGGFPQISGLRVTVAPENPAGRKVVSLTRTDGTPVDMNRTYELAVSDFLAQGGDGYPVLARLPVLKLFPSPDQALLQYLRDKGAEAFTPLDKPRIVLRGLKVSLWSVPERLYARAA